MKRLIFLDVDDTLLSPPHAAVKRVWEWFNKGTFPSDAEFRQRKALQFYDAFPHVFANAKAMWAYALLALPFGYFRSQHALDMDVGEVSTMLADERVYLVSKNPPLFSRWRRRRLKEIFGVDLGDRYIACGPIFGKAPTKFEIAKRIAQSRNVPLQDCLFVDDSSEAVLGADALGLRAALVDSPWNRSDQATLDASFVVTSTQRLGVLLREHLGTVRPDVGRAYLVPPLTVTTVARLATLFLTRWLLLGERIPRLKEICPLARHPTMSVPMFDPHATAMKRIEQVVVAHPTLAGVRVVDTLSSHSPSLLPLGTHVGGLESEQPRRRVHHLRETCRAWLENRGHELGASSLYHFSAVDRLEEIERIRKSPRLHKAMGEYERTHGASYEAAMQLATQYLTELVGGRSYRGSFLTWKSVHAVMTRTFSSVKIRMPAELRELQKDTFLVYAAVHRSYLDSGILWVTVGDCTDSFPFIVAADKMRRVWLGRLGALSGAFFLRRKFVDEIYAAILAEHVSLIQSPGNAIQVFLEGQRSRSGLTLPPKKGIAKIIWSRMLEAGTQSKVAIVPVSFVYNKLPESEMLLRERHDERKKAGIATLREVADMRIKGERKRSLYMKARSLRRRLSHDRVSECHVTFGEPVLLARSDKVASEADSMQVLQGHLNNVMTRINEATVILPTSVLCLGVLASEEHHLERSDAASFLALSRDVVAVNVLPKSSTQVLFTGTVDEQIDSFLALPFVNRKFKKHGINERGLLALSDLDLDRASYYQNNVLHFFVLPSILAAMLSHARLGNVFELHRFVDAVFEDMAHRYFLPSMENPRDYVNALLGVFLAHGLVKLEGVSYAVDVETLENSSLTILAALGQRIVKDDFLDVFERLRRVGSRTAVRLPFKVVGVSRESRVAEVVNYTSDGFFLNTNETLDVEDQVSFTPAVRDDLKLEGVVSRTEVNGASVSTMLRSVAPPTVPGDLPTVPDERLTQPARIPGTVTVNRSVQREGFLTSLSPTGALLSGLGELSQGDRVRGLLDFDGGSTPINGVVVRTSQDGVAVKFEGLTRHAELKVLEIMESFVRKQSSQDKSVEGDAR